MERVNRNLELERQEQQEALAKSLLVPKAAIPEIRAAAKAKADAAAAAAARAEEACGAADMKRKTVEDVRACTC